MWAARVVMPRCRPARRSAVAMRAWDRLAPAAGVGAMARIARASRTGQVGGAAVGEGGEEAGVELAQ
jgi:hypothetical protein